MATEVGVELSKESSYTVLMIKNTTTHSNGILHWGKKQALPGTTSHSYYDMNYYKVPFSGDYEPHKMRAVLSKRYPNTGNYFGGYTTIGGIERLDEGHVKVEMVYHIGN